MTKENLDLVSEKYNKFWSELKTSYNLSDDEIDEIKAQIAIDLIFSKEKQAKIKEFMASKLPSVKKN